MKSVVVSTGEEEKQAMRMLREIFNADKRKKISNSLQIEGRRKQVWTLSSIWERKKKKKQKKGEGKGNLHWRGELPIPLRRSYLSFLEKKKRTFLALQEKGSVSGSLGKNGVQHFDGGKRETHRTQVLLHHEREKRSSFRIPRGASS